MYRASIRSQMDQSKTWLDNLDGTNNNLRQGQTDDWKETLNGENKELTAIQETMDMLIKEHKAGNKSDADLEPALTRAKEIVNRNKESVRNCKSLYNRALRVAGQT